MGQYVHLLEASACQRFRIKVVRVVSETLLRDQDSNTQGMNESRHQQHKASRGRFSIVDGHGFDSILRGAMEFECQPLRTRDRAVTRRDAQAPPARARNLSAVTVILIAPVIQSFR